VAGRPPANYLQDSRVTPWFDVGTLFVIGAPLATPEDLTHRAARVLRQVSLVVAGEPEQARQFLARLDLHPRLISLPQSGEGLDEALAALRSEDVVLLQEEQFPGPTRALIQAAVERGFPVVPIPGPVSPLTALVVSGLPADSFVFLGLLTEGSDLLVLSYLAERRTLVALEAADRLSETLGRLQAALRDRPLVLAGEFAGWPQGVWRGTLGNGLDHVAAYPPQGTCILVIGGAEGAPTCWDAEELQSEIRARLDRGESASGISRQLAAESGWSRREVYRQVLKSQASQHSD